MNISTNVKHKITAFKSFLYEHDQKEEIIDRLSDDENRLSVELDSGEEYLILTDDEANAEAELNIKETIWAFNSTFIVDHMRGCDKLSTAEKDTLAKAIIMVQEKLCENANPVIEALIEDIDDFIYDAIESDGRGSFISQYDGKEYKALDCYVYRMD